jgi:LDH2 family malate/lactate/ureidoglycolate dehydrogenase
MASSLLSDEALAAYWGDSPRFPTTTVREQSESLFQAFGLSAEEAEIATRPLVAADMRGIESHGVARLRSYAEGFIDGRIVADAPLTVDRETPVSIAFNANDGSGLVQGQRAMARVIEKAQETGLCMGTVRESTHFGIAGYYAMMASQAGLMGVSMTNTGALAAPTFGAKAMLGSNPIAITLPATANTPEFVLDMSTSTAAYGKIEVAQRAKKPIPAGWAIDKEGNPTTDPFAFGAFLPLGGERETSGHKGYGLGLLVDLLCGPLAGAGASHQISAAYYAGERFRIGHYFAAWRVDAFRDPVEFAEDVAALFEELRRTPVSPNSPSDRVLIPGEPESAQENYNSRHGCPVRPTVLADVQALCAEWNVPFILG